MSDTTTTIQTDAGPISREDYITRAAAVYATAGLTPEQSRKCAEIQADQETEDPSGRSPEDAADDEMSYWDNDE